MPSSGLTRAFRIVLAHELDQRVLRALWATGQEVRYESVRRAVREGSPEAFSRCIARLSAHGLLKRRLERERGKARYRSLLSPSPWGLAVAQALEGLGKHGQIPEGLPASVRGQLQRAFMAVGKSPSQA